MQDNCGLTALMYCIEKSDIYLLDLLLQANDKVIRQVSEFLYNRRQKQAAEIKFCCTKICIYGTMKTAHSIFNYGGIS